MEPILTLDHHLEIWLGLDWNGASFKQLLYMQKCWQENEQLVNNLIMVCRDMFVWERWGLDYSTIRESYCWGYTV